MDEHLLSPGTHSEKIGCRGPACGASAIVSDEDGREGVEEGGALVKSTDHSQLCQCNCGTGCNGSSKVLLRTGFLFSWSYQFTRGIIKNKTSVSMSLAT